MGRISKGKEILDSLPRVEYDPNEYLKKLKSIHKSMAKVKEDIRIRKRKQHERI